MMIKTYKKAGHTWKNKRIIYIFIRFKTFYVIKFKIIPTQSGSRVFNFI